MNARELLCELLDTRELPEVEITAITDNTARAHQDTLFVCVRGARFDGHALAIHAYENGCRLFLAECPLSLPTDAQIFLVKSTRRALALLACRFYGNPSHSLSVIGITGTKGKTTTAALLSSLLTKSGIPSGYIGTNGICYGTCERDTANTTPDPLTLQKALFDMQRAGMRAAVIEVSSQALMQYRTLGIRFSAVLFTNLFPDHIGNNEHPTFEAYRDCKHTLFTDYDSPIAIWNADDRATAFMRTGCTAKRNLFVSCADPSADVFFSVPTPIRAQNLLGIRFTVKTPEESQTITLPLVGACNACNAALATAAASACFSLPLSRIADALSTCVVEGRSRVMTLANGGTAVIDYAHNGESLSRILSALREYNPRRLLCLYGSVGERTQMRRGELARAAIKYADLSILTSDNPGCEDPERIIDEIATQYDRVGAIYLRCADRTRAIRLALDRTEAGDILLLAGKGHEKYQLVGKEKLPFCESDIIEDYEAERKKASLHSN